MDLGDPSYGIVRRLPRTAFADAVTATREALATEGFGVLTEIDVAGTLKKKLGVDLPPYVILGACNPPMAHRALQVDAAVGLLLPCNVVVADDEAGGSTVAALDPRSLFQVAGQPGMTELAEDIRARLERVLDRLA